MSMPITYAEITREIGRFLGIGENQADWTDEDGVRVTDILLRGSRRFYFPETTIGEDGRPIARHNWSFLQAEFADFINPENPYTLIDNQVWQYLPADFMRLAERLTIQGESFPLEEILEGDLRGLINSGTFDGPPQYYAIKLNNIPPVSTSIPTYMLGLHPVPTNGMILNGWYLKTPMPVGPTNPPVCPDIHAETLMESMLMVADEMMNYETGGGTGVHFQKFKALLLNSIALDDSIGAENSYAS